MKTLRLIIAILFFPLTVWYAVGVALRNAVYSLGLRKTIRPTVPTIGIGNLRMGGTGKTPHTEYLIRLLADRRVALLSRGYGRRSKGFVLSEKAEDPAATVDVRNAEADFERLGDEPAMMARKFPTLTVAVCEDRAEGVRRLMQLPQPPEVILMDDVYQHRSVRPTLSILLTEYRDPYFNDFILPFGNLREFRTGRRRADVVIVTKCPSSLSTAMQQRYRRLLRLTARQQLFFSFIDYLPPQALYGSAPWHPYREILIVTGIAHPEPLLHQMERQSTVTHLRFPDHHDFTDDDISQIIQTFDGIKDTDKAILTTEKDAMRLLRPSIRQHLEELPLFYIPIKVQLHNPAPFDNIIRTQTACYSTTTL